MTGMPFGSRDLIDRVQAFVDGAQEGTITSEQLAAFEQLLRQQPEARFLYAEMIKMSVCLPRALSRIGGGTNGRLSGALFDEVLSGTLAGNDDLNWELLSEFVPVPPVETEEGPWQANAASTDGTEGSAMAAAMPQSPSLLFRLVRLSQFLAPTLAGALLAVLTIWVGLYWIGSGHRTDRAMFPPDLRAPLVARLVKAVDCQWTDPISKPMVGSFLRQGQRLELNEGFVEIHFDGGVRLILEGPATMTIESAGKVRLERGKLAALVSAEAIGFTVRTPHAVVRDLGTEFGVDVEPGKGTQLCVFRGEVCVEPAEASFQSGRVVGAGGAVRVETVSGTTVLDTPARPERFVRDLDNLRSNSQEAIASTFDNGLDGWTKGPARQSRKLSQQPAGGNPGGTLLSTGNEPATKLVAPARYRGDLSRFQGGTISFDAKFVQSGDAEARAAGFEFGLITITGAGRSATQQIAASPPTAQWQTYRGLLTAAAFGVSPSDWEAILANVTNITINLNAFRGVPNEILAFDNIVLRRQDPPESALDGR